MYVLTQNQQAKKYPYSFLELKHDNPETSFPVFVTHEVLAEWGVFPVIQQGPPEFDPATQNLIQVLPVLQGDVWVEEWEIQPASAKETEQRTQEKAAAVREERNRRLAESDWVVIKAMETGTAVPADVVAERQALRDITAQAGFPWDVQWPSQPD